MVVREGRGSVSLLQRTLGIGYGRAARLIDYMAEDGIVGPYNGSQAREVLITLGDWEAMNGQPPTSEPKPSQEARHSNKIQLALSQEDDHRERLGTEAEVVDTDFTEEEEDSAPQEDQSEVEMEDVGEGVDAEDDVEEELEYEDDEDPYDEEGEYEDDEEEYDEEEHECDEDEGEFSENEPDESEENWAAESA